MTDQSRRTTLDMPTAMYEEIDAARGEVPRQRWIRGAIEQRLARESDPEMIAVPHRPPALVASARTSVPSDLPLGHAPKIGKRPFHCETCGRRVGDH